MLQCARINGNSANVSVLPQMLFIVRLQGCSDRSGSLQYVCSSKWFELGWKSSSSAHAALGTTQSQSRLKMSVENKEDITFYLPSVNGADLSVRMCD